jgi:hypothetical protein
MIRFVEGISVEIELILGEGVIEIVQTVHVLKQRYLHCFKTRFQKLEGVARVKSPS